MRPTGAFVALLALSFLPLAQAAVAEDGAGDVAVGAGAVPPLSDPTPLHACVDLRALDVAEDGERLLFTVTVADVSDPPQESPAGCAYAVLFEHAGREFQLYMTRVAEIDTYHPYASLGYRDSPSDSWTPVWRTSGKVEFDTAAETLWISVPRGELASADGTLPYAGRALDALHVNSATRASGDLTMGFFPGIVGSPVYAADRMPDGEAMASFEPVAPAPAAGGPVPEAVAEDSTKASPSLGLGFGVLALAAIALVRRAR